MDIATLKNPPIVEALIEIKFNPNKNITVDKLKGFAESLKEFYPKVEPIENQNFNIKFGTDNGAEHEYSSQAIGFKLSNINNNKIVIAAIDKLTVSSLTPYQPWPSLLDRIKELLASYLEYAPQTEIIRLGLRYINRVELPLREGFIFEDFISTFQPLPQHEELPKTLAGFESAILMPLNDIGAAATIRQTIRLHETDEDGNRYIPYFLDIDVFKDEKLNIDGIEQAWDSLEKMRVKKNAIFFATLKDEALKPYA